MSVQPENTDIVDRAAEAMREQHVPPVPPALIARTQALVRETAQARVPLQPASIFRHPLLRVAAVFVLLVGVAAIYATLRTRHNSPVETTSNIPPVIEKTGASPVAVPVRVPRAKPVYGRVFFVGVAPTPQVISVAANASCAAHHRSPVIDESVLVNDNGTLRNVVVWVSGGLNGRTFAPPKEPAVLDQQGCVYLPHVVTVMTGQQLLVKNSDPFLHNVRAAAANNPPFNFGQPTVDGGKPLIFASPDRLLVKCDVHPWMTAFIHVFDNPFFAVTGKDGSFALPELPPGRYTLSAWHEVYGEMSKDVTVEVGKPLRLEFTFRPAEQAAAVSAHTYRDSGTASAAVISLRG